MTNQVKKLVHTSADDCKISLHFVTDATVIREAMEECRALGYISKVKHLEQRLKQLEKAVA